MEREKITHRWLLSHGFELDETTNNLLDSCPDFLSEERTWCKDPIKFYRNIEDHRINVQHNWTNRYGQLPLN